MRIPFARSPRSSVGIEWEIQLVDRDSGDLRQAAQAVLAAMRRPDGSAQPGIVQEFLVNTVEIVTDPFASIPLAAAQIEQRLDLIRQAADPLRIDLLAAGGHPFARWELQEVTDKERYHRLIDRTQWWGRQMVIYGVHTHVGIEDRRKVLPIVRALLCYLPHLQALSASSPYWAAQATGYASNRALLFQQLPTAGLPIQFTTWDELEHYTGDMIHTGVIDVFSEIRWDIRPAPRFGTVEVRVCDALPTLREVAAVSALVQCLVEEFSGILDRGGELPSMPAWFVQENKWRSARYGMDAIIVLNAFGDELLVTDHLPEVLTRLEPVAVGLGCLDELNYIHTMIRLGASYQRQLAAAASSDGAAQAAGSDGAANATSGDGLRTVVASLVAELAANQPGPNPA
ncbi:MAG: glutamate--cysteine ligase [Bifidobacteriaceae bacterium]|jgi:carboxylate-amine ligase|nr:glutamate--cysteine ligase [Bifidobacteriaceae bacterium]